MPLSISIIKIESINFVQQSSEIPLVYKNDYILSSKLFKTNDWSAYDF